jgi:hypothetical protein
MVGSGGQKSVGSRDGQLPEVRIAGPIRFSRHSIR